MPVRDLLMAASGAGGPTDPYFYDVSLLLNGDGTNGAQNNTILDSSGTMTFSQSGNAWAQGSFSPYGNLWSNYLPGSSSYLTVSSSSAFQFSGDFTFECWYNLGSFTGEHSLFSINNGSTHYLNIDRTNSRYKFGINGTNFNFNTTFTNGVWVHVAIVRSGSTITCYENGVSLGTGTSSATWGNNTQAFWISDLAFVGYISNLRLNSSALYTSSFTPSTTPLTAVSGTTFLTCQSNRFIDNSSNAFALTANGSPSVSRFSPFNPTAPYDTATIGGSLYSQGACELDTSYSGTVGSGDNFTAEGWLYLTRVQDNLCIFITSGGLSVIQGHSGNQIASYDGSFHDWGYTPKLYEWHYYTIQRSSGTAYVWVDGIYLTSFSYSASWTWSGQRILGQTSNRENGYFSNFRFSNTTRYTNGVNFTPPTSPFTTDANTVLLISGTNAGIPDLAMQNDLQTVGSAQVSTSVKKYGTGSIAFDGSGDYLILPTNQIYAFGTGDFTVEMWAYFNSVTPEQELIDFRTTDGAFPMIYIQSGNIYYYANTGARITGTGAVTTSTWYHIALARSGTSTKLFVNGTQVGSTYTDSTNYSVGANRPIIGANGGNTSLGNLNGYIDDLRITNGYARYTANFTPPTAALPTY